ncbi:MAG: hypothetical protein CFE26_20530 [Verrucomicrobiales bacterium VVV1]|nr:MAG: hypothetical protein CFE26_20530 [Verrucomicrobiales bacterium VVV1]
MPQLPRFTLAVFLISHAFASAAPLIRVLAWDAPVAARKLALASGGSVVEITGMHPEKRTSQIQLKGDGPIQLRALDRKNAEGKAAERACTIPATMAHPLLLLMADAADPTGLRVIVFDDDPAGFHWGSYRFLNATPKELVVQLEKKVVRVPTGWVPVDLDLGGETRGIGARLALAEAMEKPLYSAVWEYDTGIRTLCFIVPGADPQIAPVAMKAVPEDRRTLELESKARKDKPSTPSP